MKNQYFGDVNDYFKYDLCIYLAENLPKVERFTFIPMLTADDSSSDGGKVEYPLGVGSESLYRFLQGCIKEGKREVSELRKYFEGSESTCGFKYNPYADSLDKEFKHDTRVEYFRGIPDEDLNSAVIMVDPDNGLEVKTSAPRNFHKFIKYSEAGELFQRMNSNSVLVVYQHFPRINHEQYLENLHKKIQKELNFPAPVTVFSSNISLVILAKNEMGRRRLQKQVAGYLRQELRLRD